MYEELKWKEIILWYYAVTEKNKINTTDKPKTAQKQFYIVHVLIAIVLSILYKAKLDVSNTFGC